MTSATSVGRVVTGGLAVRVRLTPKSSRDRIDGVDATADGPALKARVRALPSAGAANAAVEQLVAKWLGVPKSAVALSTGAKSWIKTLIVSGDAAEIGRAHV